MQVASAAPVLPSAGRRTRAACCFVRKPEVIPCFIPFFHLFDSGCGGKSARPTRVHDLSRRGADVKRNIQVEKVAGIVKGLMSYHVSGAGFMSRLVTIFMEKKTMKRIYMAVLAGALGVIANSSLAQNAVRIRGDITAINGNTLSVKTREGQDLQVELAGKASFAYMKALKLEDVKPGTPLGTSAVKGPDGKLIARELHLFSAERGVPNEGHRPWDLEPGSTMTNATVSAVAEATGGREITLTYKDGKQQVIVPADIPVVSAVEGDRSLLAVGLYVVIAATVSPDNKISATRVQVTRDGVRPPT